MNDKLIQVKPIKLEDVSVFEEDRELIELAQNNDNAAFTILVERYRTRVASIAYQVLGNYEDASDVVQDVFIKLYRGIVHFDPNKKFYTWLYRLTVNAAIDFLRSKKRHSLESSFDEQPELYANIPNPEIDLASNEVERKEFRRIVQNLARNLKPRIKAAFVLCDLQGFSADEAAEMLDCPKVTLRWYLHEARKKIRKMLIDKYPEYIQIRKSNP